MIEWEMLVKMIGCEMLVEIIDWEMLMKIIGVGDAGGDNATQNAGGMANSEEELETVAKSSHNKTLKSR